MLDLCVSVELEDAQRHRLHRPGNNSEEFYERRRFPKETAEEGSTTTRQICLPSRPTSLYDLLQLQTLMRRFGETFVIARTTFAIIPSIPGSFCLSATTASRCEKREARRIYTQLSPFSISPVHAREPVGSVQDTPWNSIARRVEKEKQDASGAAAICPI